MRWLLALVVITTSSATAADDLKLLSDTHQWFALRDAIRKVTNPPLLYQAAVACEFHDTHACEHDVRGIVRDGSPADRADAYGFLMLQHALAGHYRSAVEASEERLKASRPSAAPDSLNALLSAFDQHPDLAVASRGPSTIRYERAAGHLLLPSSINGKSARYLLDTGANFSVIVASEAKRLGLRISEVRVEHVGDATGNGFSLTKIAFADHINIGGFRLKNVPFMVLGDDLDVFTELPDGARGAFGMQVLLALGNVRWNSRGDIQLGAPSQPLDISHANLCFDGLGMLTEAGYGDTRLVFVLDTGDSESRLGPRFAREFAALVTERGKPGAWNLSGAGGVVETPATILSEFQLDLGSMRTTSAPIHIWKGDGGGREYHHGVIGLDILDQASAVALDFRSMRLSLTK
jgi:clan AA aspartic protease (TIGR02281 family)